MAQLQTMSFKCFDNTSANVKAPPTLVRNSSYLLYLLPVVHTRNFPPSRCEQIPTCEYTTKHCTFNGVKTF